MENGIFCAQNSPGTPERFPILLGVAWPGEGCVAFSEKGSFKLFGVLFSFMELTQAACCGRPEPAGAHQVCGELLHRAAGMDRPRSNAFSLQAIKRAVVLSEVADKLCEWLHNVIRRKMRFSIPPAVPRSRRKAPDAVPRWDRSARKQY